MSELIRMIDEAIALLRGVQECLRDEDEDLPFFEVDEVDPVLAPDLTHIDPECVRTVRNALLEYWRSQEGDGFYRGEGLVIDLKSVEGRAQLLVLANLLAARTSEATAEETFLALGQERLLEWESLTMGSREDRQKALEVLKRSYRAVADKQQKVDAIYSNQALLVERWAGDLNNIYAHCKDNGELLIFELQSFRHIRQRAYWIARELKVAGVWPDVEPTATAYYDAHVRRVLSRLGLVPSDESPVRPTASRDECRAIVDAWFDGDVVPLYLHGSRLCIHEDPAICAGSCPVKENCTFWMEKAEQFVADLPE